MGLHRNCEDKVRDCEDEPSPFNAITEPGLVMERVTLTLHHNCRDQIRDLEG